MPLISYINNEHNSKQNKPFLTMATKIIAILTNQ